MPHERQRRPRNGHGDETEAVVTAGEEVAQRVVEVDAVGIEERIAARAQMDIAQDRMSPADALVREADLVARRQSQRLLEGNVQQRVARDNGGRQQCQDREPENDGAAQVTLEV